MAFVVASLALYLAAPTTIRRWVMPAASGLLLASLLSPFAVATYVVLVPGVYGLGIASQPRRRVRHVAFYGGVAALLVLFVVLRISAGPTSGEGDSSTLLPTPVVLGYSYFLFRGLNFLIGSYVGTIEQPQGLAYANLMLFFPSFSAGPVTRYPIHAEDLARGARPDAPMAFEAAHRVLDGLIKKTVFVPTLAQFSLISFDRPTEVSGVGAAWIATLTFYLYLYVDFSAYTDIAIGIALAFGCRLPENFDYPILKSNLLRFWESWHMSLTSWIRDHVFTPLTFKLIDAGGARVQGAANTASYVLTMTLFGAWHSFSAAYLVFGLIQGVALAASHAAISARKRHLGARANRFIEDSLVTRICGAVLVNGFVAVTLILFRFDISDSLWLVRFMFTGARA